MSSAVSDLGFFGATCSYPLDDSVVLAVASADESPVPSSLIAETLYRYVVPVFMPSLSSYVVDSLSVSGSMTAYSLPASFLSILYPVISSPPSSSGALHDRSIPVGETSAAVRSVGLSGASASAHCTAWGAESRTAAAATAVAATAAARTAARPFLRSMRHGRRRPLIRLGSTKLGPVASFTR